MDWLNLHYSILDSPDVIGSTPTERATWLFLLRLCIGQENGGRIKGAKGWGDRKWQQVVRVTLREVQQKTTLWGWNGDDLIVSYYPIEKEEEVRRNRDNGKRGGRPKQNHLDNHLVNPLITTRFDSAETEGKGIGREGKGRESEAGQPPPDVMDGMNKDETTIELAKSIPMEINWRDWRSQHGAVFVARRGDDGDQDGWEEAFKFYGAECFDCMYNSLKATKRIYFNAAIVWLEENTEKETA